MNAKLSIDMKNIYFSIVFIFLFLIFVNSAGAATIVVDRLDDNNTAAARVCSSAASDCSLRGALFFADANSGTVITVPGGTTYTVTLGELRVGTASNILTTINGSATDATIINQTSPNARVFNLNPNVAANVVVNINNLQITGGSSPSDNFGGGGLLGGGPGNTLNISGTRFENNSDVFATTAKGGAIEWAGGGFLNINNCVFNNNTAGAGSQNKGIGGAVDFQLLNNSGAAGQGGLSITNSTFTNNRAGAGTSGAGGALAITVTTTQNPAAVNVTNNTFTGNQANAANNGHGGAIVNRSTRPLTIKYNRIVDNSATGKGTGMFQSEGTTGTVDATNNWWGCNLGVNYAECDSVEDVFGRITTAPRIVLSHTISPSPLVRGQVGTLTASFLRNSNNDVLTVANVSELLGLPVAFSQPVRGTLSNGQTAIQLNGTATATFTATATGNGSAQATLDGSAANAVILIQKGNTTIAIGSAPPTSFAGEPYTVTFSAPMPVSPATGTPTGTVTISDGTDSCTATLPATTCSLTSTTAGAKNLTATYNGDANYSASPASAPIAHQVCGGAVIVTSTADSGAGSLREALTGGCPGSSITFSNTFNTAKTIALSGEIVLNRDLEISGPGANLLTINANGTGRAFRITGGSVDLSRVTITGGSAANGGAIENTGGTLTLTESVITGNTASGLGGGIYSTSPLTIIASTVANNTANDAAGNTAGGIHSTGALTMVNSTVSGNTAVSGAGSAGGIRADAATSITNATITNNSGSSTGGVFAAGGTVTVRNSIIAANQSNASVPDVDGTFDPVSAYNLIGNAGAATGLSAGNQNQIGSSAAPLDPKIGPLAGNGGPTPTHATLVNSPAIDQGSAAEVNRATKMLGLTTDQRGQVRPVDHAALPNAAGGDGSDIGAFEFQVPTAATVTVSGRVFAAPGRGLQNAEVELIGPDGEFRSYRTAAFGYYFFDDVEVGKSYIIQVNSKRFIFEPQLVMVNEEITGLDLNAAVPH